MTMCRCFLINCSPFPQQQCKKKKITKQRILVQLQDSLRSDSADRETIIPKSPSHMPNGRFFQKTSTGMILVCECVLTELFLWLCAQFPLKDSPEVLSEHKRKMSKGFLCFIGWGLGVLFKKISWKGQSRGWKYPHKHMCPKQFVLFPEKRNNQDYTIKIFLGIINNEAYYNLYLLLPSVSV